MIPLLISLLDSDWKRIEDVPLVPLPIELFFDQLHNLSLLRLDARLLFLEPVQLRLPLRNLLPEVSQVHHPRIRVLIPDVEDRNEDVAAKVLESLLQKEGKGSTVVLVLRVVQSVRGEFESLVRLVLRYLLDILLEFLWIEQPLS